MDGRTSDAMNVQAVVNILTSPNGPEKLLKQYQTLAPVSARELLVMVINLAGSGEPAALSFLAMACRKKKEAALVRDELSAERLAALLKDESPKVRKNSARLIGNLYKKENSSDREASSEETHLGEHLFEALQNESVRMVRPSLILALGAIGQAERLKGYEIPPAADVSEEKHVKEETQALQIVLRQDDAKSALQSENLSFPTGTVFEMTCGEGFEDALVKALSEFSEVELFEIPDASMESPKGSVRFKSSEPLKGIPVWTALRMYRDWRVVLGPEEEAPALLAAFVKEGLGGDRCRLRIDVPKTKSNRKEKIQSLFEGLEQAAPGFFVNAPSSYQVELLLREGEALVRLDYLPDHRFEYRRKAIPASILPANAAGVIALAAPYLKAGARVLDPCCGSGTLLFERLLATNLPEPSILVGLDIEKRAIQVAKTNLESWTESRNQAPDESASNPETFKFYQQDLTTYEAPFEFDEVFANLPFGNRVGTHKANEELYARLVQRLPKWLASGGHAFLYTMEGRLTEGLLQKEKGLKVLRVIETEAGGLKPKLFIVEKE